MKVFISWSGDLSRKIGLLLNEWLKEVIQAVEPYFSDEALRKGSRWFSEICKELEISNFGILCLTSNNLESPWIHFEAGALSKQVGQSNISPLLINISARELKDPLSEFTGTKLEKDDMWKLIKEINKQVKDHPLEEKTLEKAFNRCWPEFEANYNRIIAEFYEGLPPAEKEKRDPNDVLEEVLMLVRGINQSVQELSGPSLRRSVGQTLADIFYQATPATGAGISGYAGPLLANHRTDYDDMRSGAIRRVMDGVSKTTLSDALRSAPEKDEKEE